MHRTTDLTAAPGRPGESTSTDPCFSSLFARWRNAMNTLPVPYHSPAAQLAKPPTRWSHDEDGLTVNYVLTMYTRWAIAEDIHAPSSAAYRDRTFRLFSAEYGDMPVTELRGYHLTNFVLDHPDWKATATKRRQAGIVKAAFSWAYRQERILRNPFQNIRYPAGGRAPEMPDVTLDKILKITNKNAEQILRFLRLTGARSSEACDATWADVDLDKAVWTIPKHKQRKKTRKPRIVALTAAAVALLLAVAVDWAVVWGVDPKPADPLFLNSKGRPFSRHNLWYAVYWSKLRGGLDCNASTHGIRHRFAGEAIASGASLPLVAAQLGHAKVQTTMDHYVDLSLQIDSIREAAALGAPKSVQDGEAAAEKTQPPPEPPMPSRYVPRFSAGPRGA
jgi:integrase